MKTKAIFLTAIFSLLLVAGAWAQEKYEYAEVVYSPNAGNKNYKICFTQSASNDCTNGAVEKGDAMWDTSPLIKFVEDLTSKGWDVYSAQSTKYFLRKKKN